MTKESNYHPSKLNVIWDIYPNEFNSNGNLEKFIQIIKNENFNSLLRDELQRVSPFLEKWGDLLHQIAPISAETLKEWFLKTPKLSGVIYFSHSTILSESFFSKNHSHLIRHPTDRIMCQEAATSLPSAKDLTFSFPRQYNFDGFYNSWGFIRIERDDENMNGAGVALSVVTLDSEVLGLIRQHGFQDLIHLYNQSWNHSIHDYIHHLALYTNPSFGIGKYSPMSIHNQNHAIDQWGEDMISTFNYEYWAHRTHRLITENLTDLNDDQIILDAHIYFEEVRRFQEHLINHQYKLEYVQNIGQYLGCIYLWPLHILMHPHGSQMNSIGHFIERLILPEKQDRILNTLQLLQKVKYPFEPSEQAKTLLQFIHYLSWTKENFLLKEFILLFEEHQKNANLKESISFFDFLHKIASKENPFQLSQNELRELVDINKILLNHSSSDENLLRTLQITYLNILSHQEETPLQKGMSTALKALQFDLEIDQNIRPFNKYEWLRFKTEATVQRGMYNCWDHEYPVIYQQKPTHSLKIFHHFFEILNQTYVAVEPSLSKENHYKLSGIYPHAFNYAP